MASKAVRQSPPDGDERRKPDGAPQPRRRNNKKGPVEKPGQNPHKPQPARAARAAAPAAAATVAVREGSREQRTGGRARKAGAADQREALFNAGAVGTFRDVMVQRHEVTRLRGILIEIDLECLRVGNVIHAMPADGFELYERHAHGWLGNHPVLQKAEVRFSGRGLHCILNLDKPIEIASDRQRELWNTVVRAVQRALPSDPEAPSLLAMTRPVGSVNSKTGRKVELLQAGEPVTEQEVLALADDLTCRGFATITQILFGTTTVSPCPICRKTDSTLHGDAPKYRTTNPHVSSRGSCYHCGRPPLATLIDLVLKDRDEEADGDTGDGAGRDVGATSADGQS